MSFLKKYSVEVTIGVSITLIGALLVWTFSTFTKNLKNDLQTTLKGDFETFKKDFNEDLIPLIEEMQTRDLAIINTMLKNEITVDDSLRFMKLYKFIDLARNDSLTLIQFNQLEEQLAYLLDSANLDQKKERVEQTAQNEERSSLLEKAQLDYYLVSRNFSNTITIASTLSALVILAFLFYNFFKLYSLREKQRSFEKDVDFRRNFEDQFLRYQNLELKEMKEIVKQMGKSSSKGKSTSESGSVDKE